MFIESDTGFYYDVTEVRASPPGTLNRSDVRELEDSELRNVGGAWIVGGFAGAVMGAEAGERLGGRSSTGRVLGSVGGAIVGGVVGFFGTPW